MLVSFFHSKLYGGRPNYEISRDLQEKEDLLLLTFYHSSRVCCARRHIQLWRGVIVELMRQTNERVRGCINRFYNSSGVLHVVVPKLHVCTTVSPTSTKCGTIFLKLGLSTANSFRQKVYLSSKKLQKLFRATMTCKVKCYSRDLIGRKYKSRNRRYGAFYVGNDNSYNISLAQATIGYLTKSNLIKA